MARHRRRSRMTTQRSWTSMRRCWSTWAASPRPLAHRSRFRVFAKQDTDTPDSTGSVGGGETYTQPITVGASAKVAIFPMMRLYPEELAVLPHQQRRRGVRGIERTASRYGHTMKRSHEMRGTSLYDTAAFQGRLWTPATLLGAGHAGPMVGSAPTFGR